MMILIAKEQSESELYLLDSKYLNKTKVISQQATS